MAGVDFPGAASAAAVEEVGKNLSRVSRHQAAQFLELLTAHGNVACIPAKVNIEKPVVVAPKSMNSVNQRGKQPYNHDLDHDLIHAVGYNDVEKVNELLADGTDPNARDDSTSWTVLEEGAYRGSLDSVKVLLAAGANVNAKEIWAEQLCISR